MADLDSAPPRPARRRVVAIIRFALVALLGAVVGAQFLGGPTVGHFTTAEGREAYLDAYAQAQAEGPAPDAALDIRTDWGVVRVWRFDGTGQGAGEDAESVLLLPGTSSGAPMWTDNLPSLTRDRTVYALDLLGEPGLSVQEQPLTDAADVAAWIAQVIEALPGPQHVMGHSLGGWMAMNLAVHEPEASASIIVLDPVSTFADLPFAMIVRSIPASVPWFPKAWRDDFASWTANGAPVEDVPVAQMIEAGMQHYAVAAPAPARFTDEQLAGVDVPVLVIIAGASVVHDPAAAAEAARRTLPNATALVYDGASHAINGEEPERIADDVDNFLSSVED
jgi:pimeloyl-ACP methyl ester carboxylesterase